MMTRLISRKPTTERQAATLTSKSPNKNVTIKHDRFPPTVHFAFETCHMELLSPCCSSLCKLCFDYALRHLQIGIVPLVR